MDFIMIFFVMAILLYSVIIHEYMHGWAAYMMGDPTAKLSGRLTMNPIPHIDPVGSILFPAILYIMSFPVFGWAKPVPYNPYNLRDKEYGPAIVAVAGPASNLALAFLVGLAFRFLPIPLAYMDIIVWIVMINVALAVFNLLPVPPLDGSKVIAPFLPYKVQIMLKEAEKFGMLFIFLLVWVGIDFIFPIINRLVEFFLTFS